MSRIKVGEGESTVWFPSSASDWQLYESRDGAAGSASRLTRALISAYERFDDLLPYQGAQGALAVAWTEMYSALRREAEWGALDSEPRSVASQALEDYASARAGADVRRVH